MACLTNFATYWFYFHTVFMSRFVWDCTSERESGWIGAAAIGSIPAHTLSHSQKVKKNYFSFSNVDQEVVFAKNAVLIWSVVHSLKPWKTLISTWGLLFTSSRAATSCMASQSGSSWHSAPKASWWTPAQVCKRPLTGVEPAGTSGYRDVDTSRSARRLESLQDFVFVLIVQRFAFRLHQKQISAFDEAER